MKELAILLRAMQIYGHNTHNLVGRTPFFSDHEFFGSTYSELEGDYDSVVERIIGLYGEEAVGFPTLMDSVAAYIKTCPSVGVKENSVFFQHQLGLEQKLCAKISEVIAAGTTPGTEQTLGTICEKSEIRQYKIKQRLKK